RGEEDGAFPNSENPITYGHQVTFDKANNRLLVTNWSSGGGVSSVIAVDFLTGKRSLLSGPSKPNSENLFQRPLGIVVDANVDRNRALIVDAGDMIIAMDLADGSRQILSDYTTPTSNQPELDTPTNIALDPDNLDIAYIVDEGVSNVQILNLITGAR